MKKPRYLIREAVVEVAHALRGQPDQSPTTIRCMFNDLLDAKDKEGFEVNFEYDQPHVVHLVKKTLEVLR